jgi:hypothetical protein
LRLLINKSVNIFGCRPKMNCDNEELSPTSAPTVNVVFEASTQTPTNEDCESPLFTQKGYCLKTAEHSHNALSNIQKMKHQGQVGGVSMSLVVVAKLIVAKALTCVGVDLPNQFRRRRLVNI